MSTPAPQFDPVRYKQTTHDQWQAAAEAWYRWSPTLHDWLAKATEQMIELAGITTGHRVLDVAAGAGEQSITVARKVGPTGAVLATDIAPAILEFAQQMARQEGLTNIETRVMDGEQLTLPDASFDAVISRVGLIYFPDQQKALSEMRRVLKPGGRVAAIVYSTPDRNGFFSIPVGIIRKRARLPVPLPGQPGPFSLGGEGVIEQALIQAGFRQVQAVRVDSPLRLASAAECVRFEKESFGALHQMLGSLSQAEQEAVWQEIQSELQRFEGEEGFVGPCEMIVAVGRKD